MSHNSLREMSHDSLSSNCEFRPQFDPQNILPRNHDYDMPRHAAQTASNDMFVCIRLQWKKTDAFDATLMNWCIDGLFVTLMNCLYW